MHGDIGSSSSKLEESDFNGINKPDNISFYGKKATVSEDVIDGSNFEIEAPSAGDHNNVSTSKDYTPNTEKGTIKSAMKILSSRSTALLLLITFVEAFIYSIVVTSLPVLATRFLGWGKFELTLLSLTNKSLSVLISASVYYLTDYFGDFLLLIYGIEFSLMALLTLSVLQMVHAVKIASTVLLFFVAASSIAGIPLIITSTRSMLAKLVPSEVQSLSEAVRMSVFEASFVPAGFLVPLVTMNLPFFSIGLLLVSLFVITLAVRERYTLVQPCEQDLYWQDDTAEKVENP